MGEDSCANRVMLYDLQHYPYNPAPFILWQVKKPTRFKNGVYQKFRHEQCLYFLSSFYTFWILFPDSSIESSQHEIFSLARRKIVSPVKASYTTNKPLCSFAHRIVTVQFFGIQNRLHYRVGFPFYYLIVKKILYLHLNILKSTFK